MARHRQEPMDIYPDRDLIETYIENQSLWEEVWAGETNLFDALSYMRLEPGSRLYDQVKEALRKMEPPL